MSISSCARAGDALIDGIGDAMRDTPPLAGIRIEAQSPHLAAGEDVPKPEFDGEVSGTVAGNHRAGNQGLSVDLAPVGKARKVLQLLRRLDEGTAVQGSEQARAFEVGTDHIGDVAAELGRFGGLSIKFADRDRQGLDDTLSDVDFQLRQGR